MSRRAPVGPMRIVALCLAILPAIAVFADLPTAAFLDLAAPDRAAPFHLSTSLLAGYETGEIPDSFADLSVSALPWRWLEMGVGAILLLFPQRGEYRVGSLDAYVGFPLAATEWLTAYPFLNASVQLGAPVVEPYTGALSTVSAVVSPRADGGYDLSAGLAVGVRPQLFDGLGTSLVLSAAYERTEGRDPSLGLPAERQRLAFRVAPVLVLGGDTYPRATVAWIQSVAYWFDRGYLYDSIPHVTVGTSRHVAVSAAVSAPVLGGRVWRFFGGLRVTIGPVPPKETREIRIVLEELHFPPDSADLFGFDDPGPIEENRRLLAELYERLQEYPAYKITVEGHTSFVHWDDPVLGPREEREELFPLSQARAEAVRAALVDLGMDARRIVAVGKAATEPVVPFSDSENQWKNRRVVVVLRRA